MSFPIHITNIYELLNEDGEPVPQVNTKSGASDDKNTARTTQSRGTTQNASATRGNSQGSAKPQGARDGQRRTNDNRPPRQDNRPPRSIDRQTVGDAPVGGDFQEGAPVRRDRSERTRDSAHRSSERRARNADQVGEVGGRRVFDRRSGTGRGREIKKSGAGRGNWGKEGEEQTENWDATPEEGKVVKEGEKTEEAAPVEKDPRQEEEERLAREEQEKEDKMITLEAYLKQKEATAVKIDLPKERKANEGVDQKELSKWGSYQVLKKDDDDVTVSKSEAREKTGKNTVPVDKIFNVREPPRPRADREDRGGFRGRGGNRGGRGGSRGGRGGSRRGGESAPNFDLNSFPTLATKA